MHTCIYSVLFSCICAHMPSCLTLCEHTYIGGNPPPSLRGFEHLIASYLNTSYHRHRQLGAKPSITAHTPSLLAPTGQVTDVETSHTITTKSMEHLPLYHTSLPQLYIRTLLFRQPPNVASFRGAIHPFSLKEASLLNTMIHFLIAHVCIVCTIMIVQTARIAGFRRNSIPLPSPGGSNTFKCISFADRCCST